MKANIVTIGSALYLGTLIFDDNQTTLKEGMPVAGPDVTVNDCANYLKCSNAGTLEKDIVIRGNAAVFSERELSDDLKAEVAILEAKFAKAAKTAIPNLVNTTFDRIR